MSTRRLKLGLAVAGPLLTVLAVASMATFYYMQFVYLPAQHAAEVVPENIAKPPQSVTIDMVKGSFNIEQPENFVPKEMKIILGKNNKIIWTNSDEVAHTVTADPGQAGAFAQTASRSNFVQLKEKFEFVFTKPGTYKYHCEPHPWMKGTVVVEEAGGA